MKKVIVSLLALALATTGAFAAVDFSGELIAGYAFQYNDIHDEWTNHIMGQDGEDTNTTKLLLGIGDEDGLWNVSIEGNPTLDDSGAVSGDISVDLAKLIGGSDTDWTAAVALNVLDRMTGLRAYSMAYNLDRIRSAEVGMWTSLTLGYSDLVKLYVGGSPNTVLADDTNDITANEGDLMVSALVSPLDGLSVSATYMLKGDGQDSGLNSDDSLNNFGKGIIGASADINITRLIGLDFDLGVGLSEKYVFEGDNNVFAAAVYAGFDPVSIQLQYGLITYGDARTAVGEKVPTNDDKEHFIYAGVDVTAVENLLLDAYFGAYNAAEFADSWFIGADVGYTVKNVTFQLGLEYGAGTSYNYADNYYKTDDSGAGLWIVPSIAVAW